MPITKDYEFSCPSCREPIQFFLPEQTKLASFVKCIEKDAKYHNLPLTTKCQNCGNLNTVFYCISGHRNE
jgi:hypothetical protein